MYALTFNSSNELGRMANFSIPRCQFSYQTKFPSEYEFSPDRNKNN